MLLLESGDAVAFTVKTGGPLEIALVEMGADEVETVVLHGHEVAKMLYSGLGSGGLVYLEDAGLRVDPVYCPVGCPVGGSMISHWEIGAHETRIRLSRDEAAMLKRAIENRMWRMYQ